MEMMIGKHGNTTLKKHVIQNMMTGPGCLDGLRLNFGGATWVVRE